MNKRSLLATLLATTMMAACGGGGGGGGGEGSNSNAQIDSGAGISPGPQTTQQASLANENQVGIGIYNLSYYDQSFAMADVVRHSQLRGLDWGTDVGADANGEPTRDFIMIFSAKVIGAGTYKLSFKGQATIEIAATPNGVVANKQYNAATNTTTADIILPQDSTNNTWLTFKNTRRTASSVTADGLSDIHMWRPGYPTDGSEMFTREFLTAMGKFHVVRTMDFINANRNGTENWSERTRINFPGYTGDKGQSWELTVMLANATNRDLWINVPVKANDDYIQKLAKLIKYGSDGVEPYSSPQANPKYPPLKPGLKVYVEYGNEIWNPGPGFYGFHWAQALANQYRLDTSHPIAYDGAVTDQYIALRRWVAYRSAFISQSFRQVFGDAAMMTRVRPIFAAQVNDGQAFMSGGLAWAEGYHGDVTRLWYGGGGAAYYDSTTPPNDTSEPTMQAYFAGLPSAQFAINTATDAIWTKGYGLKTIAYEGGPGPGGSANGTISGTSADSYTYNNDPRMKDRMLVAHDTWLRNGGDMLVYYVYSASAPWAFSNGLLMSTVSDTTSTKLQAIDAIRTGARPAPTLGTAIPGTVYLRDPNSKVITRINGGTAWRYNGTAYRIVPNATDASKSEFVLVPVHAANAGTYKISITSFDSVSGDRVEVLANGKLIGEITPNTGPAGQAVQSPELSADLDAGVTVIRVRAKAGSGVWLRDVLVSQ
jgi:hypothetical protein